MSSLRWLKRGAAALSLTFSFYGLLQAQAQATNFPNQPPILLGAAWYPEQWPESRWNTDLGLMEKAHIHVVRIGEFAWSSMEPQEGVYKFGWLDRAIALAAQHHIAVVLGTPTPGLADDKVPPDFAHQRPRGQGTAWQPPAVLLY